MNTRTKPRKPKIYPVKLVDYLPDGNFPGQVASKRDLETLQHAMESGQPHLLTPHMVMKLLAGYHEVCRLHDKRGMEQAGEIEHLKETHQGIVNEYDAKVKQLEAIVAEKDQTLELQSKTIQEAAQRAQELDSRIAACEAKVQEIQAQKGSQEPQEVIVPPSSGPVVEESK